MAERCRSDLVDAYSSPSCRKTTHFVFLSVFCISFFRLSSTSRTLMIFHFLSSFLSTRFSSFFGGFHFDEWQQVWFSLIGSSSFLFYALTLRPTKCGKWMASKLPTSVQPINCLPPLLPTWATTVVWQLFSSRFVELLLMMLLAVVVIPVLYWLSVLLVALWFASLIFYQFCIRRLPFADLSGHSFASRSCVCARFIAQVWISHCVFKWF